MPFWFFTSYARADRDSYLEQFFTDLRNEVRNIVGGSHEHISFVDTHDIEAAEEWKPTLAEALRASRICVALCSQSYFNSTYCGKEYKVFLERHEALSLAHPQHRHRVIFPVLWVRPLQGLPEVVTRFQFTHSDFPEVYAKEGLHYVMKLSRHKDEYQDFVVRLARKLVDAGNEIALEETRVVRPLSQVPSAFHTPALAASGSSGQVWGGSPNNVRFCFIVGRREELHELRASLDGYHESAGWFWRPYHPHADVTVGLLAQEIASRLKLRYLEMEMGQDLVGQIRKLEHANEVVVFVTDAWSVRVPRYAGPLQTFDQAMFANCAFLVAWNDADPETSARHLMLRQALHGVFPRKIQLDLPAHDWHTIRSEKDLREKLERALTEVRMTILHLTEAQRKAESQELTQTAEQQGLALGAKPHLTGPGGGIR